MKILLDFFPILLFFIAYKLANSIFIATGVAIIATVCQVSWLWLRQRRIEPLHLVTLILLILFGGLTIVLKNPIFIMWKPTLINWLFALILIGNYLITRRPLTEKLMGKNITLPVLLWRRLDFFWSSVFLFLGGVNLFVVYIGSGFYPAQQALLTASGQPTVNLATCAQNFTGELLNLCHIAQSCEATWVDFKLFGMLGLTLAFALIQALYLARYLKQNPSALEID